MPAEEKKRKYEIINPSDKCYITAEKATACMAALYLGKGKYGLSDAETGEDVLPIFLFGSDKALDQWAVDNYGELFGEFAKKQNANPAKLAEAFESFKYPHERSSMNNIGAYAASLAKHFRAEATKETANASNGS